MKMIRNSMKTLIILLALPILAFALRGWIDYAAVCDENVDYDVKVGIHLERSGDGQYFTGFVDTLTNNITLSDDLVINGIIFLSTDGKQYRRMLQHSVRFCKAVRRYLANFAWEIEKEVGLPPETCPIPPGNYSMANRYLHINDLPFKSFPRGKLKVIGTAIDTRTNKTLGCVNIAATIE